MRPESDARQHSLWEAFLAPFKRRPTHSRFFRAAQPLQVRDRNAFLQAVAERLRNCPEPGDGQVFRAVAEAQKMFFSPPLEVEGGRRISGGKYS